MKYTPGPWKVEYEQIHYKGVVSGIYAGKTRIVETDLGFYPPSQGDAERIVACVNACHGINPEAVPEMLKALKATEDDLWNHRANIPGTSNALSIVQKAIAKAEGEV